jgi:hypothetical protein
VWRAGLCFYPVRSTIKRGVEKILNLVLGDHVGPLPPVCDGANRDAKVLSERFVGHAQRLTERVCLCAGPRRGDLHDGATPSRGRRT